MAARRPATATLNAVSSPRRFSNNSSKKSAAALYKDEVTFNMPQIPDVFNAPTRVMQRTAVLPIPQQRTLISSLPPPITFDGPSTSRPRAAVNAASVAGSIVEMFDGPARPRATRRTPSGKGTLKKIAVATVVTALGTAVAVANVGN